MPGLLKTPHRNFRRRPLPLALCLAVAISSFIFLDQRVFSRSEKTRDLPSKISICGIYPAKEFLHTNIASDNVGAVYLSTTDGTIIHLDSQTLQKIWQTELGGTSVSAILVDDENVYSVGKYSTAREADERGNDALFLRALDKSTGITKWQTEINSPETFLSEKIYLSDFKNRLIVVGDSGGMASFDKASGNLIWKREAGERLSSAPLLEPGKIIVGTFNRRISDFSTENGRLLEVSETPAPPTAIGRDETSGGLIVGDQKGSVLFFGDGKRIAERRFRSGAKISNLKITPAGVLVTSLDNFVYLLSKTSGELIWKKRLAGRILAEPLVSSEYFILASAEASAASVFELRSGRLFNEITLDEGNFFTGQSHRVGNIVFYNTLRGLFSFSLVENGCPARKSGAPDRSGAPLLKIFSSP